MEKKDKISRVPEGRYQEVQDSLRNIREKVVDLVERVKGDVVTLSKVGRKKMDIISLKRQRDTFLSSLGKKTYELIKHGAVSIPELTELSGKLDEFSVKISSLEREVEAMARKVRGHKGESGGESGKSRIRVKKKPLKKGGLRKEEEEE